MISRELENWLEDHNNFEAGTLSRRATMPTLERMQTLVKFMGDPQENVKSIHITGTNGKTSTTRITETLLRTKGLYTGLICSPHLSIMNERICLDGKPCTDSQLEQSLKFVRDVENSVDQVKQDRPSYFEIFVAAGFELMNQEAIDVGVIEVGMGGLFDATNVCASQVSVLTNVGLDHVEYLGNTREKIAAEKSGIIKPGNKVVICEPDDQINSIWIEKANEVGAQSLLIDQDFRLLSNEQAVGGRLLSFETPYSTYLDMFLPLFGRYQGYNALAAVVASECFIDAALGEEVVAEGLSNSKSPGRLEVMQHQPLVLLDGAHNVAGAQSLCRALEEDFVKTRRIFVLGLTREKDPVAMINAMQIENDDVVIVSAANSPRAMETETLARALKECGIETVIEVQGSANAIENALSLALDDDQIIVTGSLYLVGEIREKLTSS